MIGDHALGEVLDVHIVRLGRGKLASLDVDLIDRDDDGCNLSVVGRRR